MIALSLVTLIATTGCYFLLGPALAGTPKLWLWLSLSQLPVFGLALYFLHRNGDLRTYLKPKPGDILRGVSLAAVLTIAIWAGRALLMPHGSPREAWLGMLYIVLGDPLQLERVWWVPLAIIGWAVSDEVIWRTWLQSLAIKRFGTVRGVGLTAICYAIPTLPSLVLLATPAAGRNPLIWILALCCGATWGYVTTLSGRAVPAIVAHATLAYFSILQFRPGL